MLKKQHEFSKIGGPRKPTRVRFKLKTPRTYESPRPVKSFTRKRRPAMKGPPSLPEQNASLSKLQKHLHSKRLTRKARTGSMVTEQGSTINGPSPSPSSADNSETLVNGIVVLKVKITPHLKITQVQ